MNDKIAKRNALALNRLQLLENYFELLGNVEQVLESFRFNLSKARTITGTSCLSDQLIGRDLTPSTWIYLNESEECPKFSILSGVHVRTDVNNDIDKSNDLRKRKKNTSDGVEALEDEEGPKSPLPAPFRPFGILEPQNVKEARRAINSSLPLICDLANVRAELAKLTSELMISKSEMELVES